jgi:HK97 gp10 family phage protein
VEIKLQGFAELQKRIAEFGPKIAANEQRNATRAAAVVFRDAVRASAPVRTGLLKASVVVNKRRSTEGPHVVRYGVRLKPGKKQTYGNTRANRRSGRVGKKYQTDSPAFYGKFLEYGTSKMTARPFMRPAFGPNVSRALEAFKARLAKGIEKAAAGK